MVYSYAPGRGSEHAIALLQGYTGVLQTDAYAAYDKLADPKRVGGQGSRMRYQGLSSVHA